MASTSVTRRCSPALHEARGAPPCGRGAADVRAHATRVPGRRTIRRRGSLRSASAGGSSRTRPWTTCGCYASAGLLRGPPGGSLCAAAGARAAPRGSWSFGHDFRFRPPMARGPRQCFAAAGDASWGSRWEVLAPVTLDGERISSSGVRAGTWRRGTLSVRGRWLGRPWSMRGAGHAGQGPGTGAGISDRESAPSSAGARRSPGFFAVARARGGQRGAAGRRQPRARVPTIGGVEGRCWKRTCSIYCGDLYGREIEVEFAAKLRDEACLHDARGAHRAGCGAMQAGCAPHPALLNARRFGRCFLNGLSIF